jgi:hypothetical protein
VWALQDGDSLIIGGKSNRRKEDFQQEIDRILNLVPEIVAREKLVVAVLPNGSRSESVAAAKVGVKAASE